MGAGKAPQGKGGPPPGPPPPKAKVTIVGKNEICHQEKSCWAKGKQFFGSQTPLPPPPPPF